MTRFDFDVIGDSPRLQSRPPDKAAAQPAPPSETQGPAATPLPAKDATPAAA